MLTLIIILLTAVFVPFITIYALKYFKVADAGKVQKTFSVTLLGIEIFKFFLCAGLFPDGMIPATNLPFSILTPLAVIFVYASLSKTKAAKILGTAAVSASAAALAFACFTDKTYAVWGDIHSVFPALFAVQLGLCFTIGILHIKKHSGTGIIGLITAESIVVIVMLLTLLTNAYFDSAYLFEYAREKSTEGLSRLFESNILSNILLCLSGLTFTAAAHFAARKAIKTAEKESADVLL